jgi:hypothetical protein
VRYQNTMNKQANLVTCAFFLLQGENTYARKWMTQDVLVELMEKKKLVPSNFFKKSTITRVIGRAIPDIDNIFNEKGIIRMNVQKDGKKIYGFYFRNKLEDYTSYPRGVDNWYKVAHKTLDSLQVSCVPLRTRSRPLSPSAAPSASSDSVQVVSKRQRTTGNPVLTARFLSDQNHNENDSSGSTNLHAVQTDQTGQQETQQAVPAASPQIDEQQQQQQQQNNHSQILTQQTKWDAPETFKYFLGKRRYAEMKRDKALHTVNIKGHLEMQIKKFRKAYLTFDGWRDIVDDKDPYNLCSHYEIFVFRMKARYLAVTLSLMLKHYLDMKVEDCCKLAIEKVNEFDAIASEYMEDEDSEFKSSKSISNARTIMTWFDTYRDYDVFPNPSTIRSGKTQKPQLFQNNPDLFEAFLTYTRDNLDMLSTEMVHSYLLTIALPEVVRRRNEEKEDDEDPDTIDMVLKESGVRKGLHHSTVHNWLKLLNFKYDVRKKLTMLTLMRNRKILCIVLDLFKDI